MGNTSTFMPDYTTPPYQDYLRYLRTLPEYAERCLAAEEARDFWHQQADAAQAKLGQLAEAQAIIRRAGEIKMANLELRNRIMRAEEALR